MEFKKITVTKAELESKQDKLSEMERAEHLKSFGIEIVHSRFVYCKRCNFALQY